MKRAICLLILLTLLRATVARRTQSLGASLPDPAEELNVQRWPGDGIVEVSGD
jgi:hypothetical protein